MAELIFNGSYEFRGSSWMGDPEIGSASISTETDVLTFSITDQSGSSTIDSGNHTITGYYASGSGSTQTITYTLSDGASGSPLSGTSQDVNSLTLTVTAEDTVTQQDWTITFTEGSGSILSTETDILTFSITEQSGSVTIDSGSHTITGYYASGSGSTQTITYTLSDGASGSPLSGTSQDVSNLAITVTAEDGITQQEWTITFDEGSGSGVELLTETDVLTFSITDQSGSSTIDSGSHTITGYYASGSGSTQTITYTLSDGATGSPLSGTSQDVNSLTLTVTAEDTVTQQDWTITFTEGSSSAVSSSISGSPITYNSTNNRYFDYKGEPTVVVTSGEHYGAVLNTDFDYDLYLATLTSASLNGTRVCSGANVEYQGWYNIAENTWAPGTGSYIAPWARSTSSGYAGGGNKFDLNTWDTEYFTRLKDFMDKAYERDIIVEFFFFTNIYTDALWDFNILNDVNNVNNVGTGTKEDTYDHNNTTVKNVQLDLIEKIVTELNDYPNLIWELANEPYINSQIPDEWQASMSQKIIDVESTLTNQHLISENTNNYSYTISSPDPNVDLFNLHYARSASAYTDNYDVNKLLGCNETGFSQNNKQYRDECYISLLAGAAYWNNLDYSFIVGGETGSEPPAGNPAGGGTTLRNQIRYAKEFFETFDFINGAPSSSVVNWSDTARAIAFGKHAVEYGIYIDNEIGSIQLNIPSASYYVEWMNTKTGTLIDSESFGHSGGLKLLNTPTYTDDVVFSVRAV